MSGAKKSRTRQPRRLRQSRQVHAAAAVTRNGIEIHPAVIAVGESEHQRAPRAPHDLSRIEVRNPAPTGWLLDSGDRCGVATVSSDAGEPGLLHSRGIEGEPSSMEAVV